YQKLLKFRKKLKSYSSSAGVSLDAVGRLMKTYSIILFAMVDADYCFTYIDVGGNGRASDSGVFRDSTLNIAMENKIIGFPENSLIVGDDAFPLRPDLMKPFSKHGLSDEETIFSYRLSCA
ncbi:hypothetical protein JTB14_002248, partial [Gonioctena quinquepunctata]